MSSEPVLVQPGEGYDLHAFGEVATVMLGGTQTSNQLAVVSAETPPGLGPPPHIHRDEDELFLVLEGSISYFSGGQWTRVRPGGAVWLPRNSLHTYRNDGDTPSRHWIITTPSGFETFFARCAAEFASTGGPDMERIVDICLEHGIELQPG